MDKIRVGLYFKDPDAVKDNLERAKKLVEDVSHTGRRGRSLCGVVL